MAYAAEGRAAVVVLGEDPVAAALVALGIAREHARRRRVAVADLVGEVEPLQALVTGDDPHGVVDSFLYGVSLNKIARQVEDGSNLFVMPSGTEPVLTEDIFRNARWRRLASGFREMGALLLLVAPLSAAGVDALVDAMDGAIVVGEPQASPILPDRVLASVREPRRTPRLSPVRGVDRVQRTAPPPAPSGDDGRGWILPTIAAAIVLAAVGFFLTRTATRQLRRTAAAPVVAARDTAPAPASAQPAPSAAPADTVAPADPLAPLVLANPADSAQASAYGVLVVTTNTPEGASLRLRQGGAGFPAATVAPVTLGSDGSRWFQVVAGAYPARASADSLLARLRARRLLSATSGRVVRAPYALLVERSVSSDAAKALASGYAGRGLPVYALLQPDGTARLYAGAFETPDKAALLAATLREAGIEPTLVYRMGRAF